MKLLAKLYPLTIHNKGPSPSEELSIMWSIPWPSGQNSLLSFSADYFEYIYLTSSLKLNCDGPLYCSEIVIHPLNVCVALVLFCIGNIQCNDASLVKQKQMRKLFW